MSSERARQIGHNLLLTGIEDGIPKLRECVIRSWVRAFWAREMSTCGGSSDTDVNELTVMPC